MGSDNWSGAMFVPGSSIRDTPRPCRSMSTVLIMQGLCIVTCMPTPPRVVCTLHSACTNPSHRMPSFSTQRTVRARAAGFVERTYGRGASLREA